jgi:hypothetical protein
MTPPNDYRAAFEAAHREYEELGKQEKAIAARRTQLLQFMVTASPLVGEDPPEIQSGLMDAIRRVLRSTEDGLRPTEVLAHVKALGIALPDNALPAIHVTLKRLVDSQEVVRDTGKDGKKRYRWVGKSVTIEMPLGGLSMQGSVGQLSVRHRPGVREYVFETPLPLKESGKK